jgi:hypothetical protein
VMAGMISGVDGVTGRALRKPLACYGAIDGALACGLLRVCRAGGRPSN